MSVHPLPPPESPRDLSTAVSRSVRRYMAEYQVNQRDLADVLGVSQPQVSERLRGVTPWRLDDLTKLAILFSTTPAELLGDTAYDPQGGPSAGRPTRREDDDPGRRVPSPRGGLTLLPTAV